MELLELYEKMARARAFELVLADLWQQGLISGEMHLGTGEEAVAAGVAAHLTDGDAVALDHRPTPMLTLLGVDWVAMLREMLGYETGLCGGWGGHMHLFAPERLAASSGIVGAAGPVAAGFALAGRSLRPGSAAVAFFGDGAANQGMLLESLNLASCWKLPVLFVCKDNGWAITTRSAAVTGGALAARARAFGLVVREVDGCDAVEVEQGVGALLAGVRKGKGPGFLLASVLRSDGHFLGDPMVRMAKSPIAEGGETFGKVLAAVTSRGGGGLGARAASMTRMMGLLRRARKDRRDDRGDPLSRARKQLEARQLTQIDEAIAAEVTAAVETALEPARTR